MVTIPKNLSISEIAEATCIPVNRIREWKLSDEEEMRVILFCELFE